MNIDTQEAVGKLAIQLPGAARVFEKFGIDYCCGGQEPLAEACRRAGLETAEVVHSLEEVEAQQLQAGAARDWSGEPLTKLTAFIVETHHVFTNQEIARLEQLLARVCTAHGNNHAELLELQELFGRLKQELLPHMLKEEQVLFPYIARLEEAVRQGLPVTPPFFGTVNHPVRMMMMEHDTAGDLLRALRRTANAYAVPADACPSYRALYQALPEFEADLHQHIHLENNLLFPRAIELETRAAPEFQPGAGSFQEHKCFGH